MSKPRIITIHESEAFLELFAMLPEGEDFEIIPFNSAEDALEKIRMEAPNLIISGVEMPGMNGFELFDKVQDSHPAIPFIMINVFGSTHEAIRAIKKGVFHYFVNSLNRSSIGSFWTAVHEAFREEDMPPGSRHTDKNKSIFS